MRDSLNLRSQSSRIVNISYLLFTVLSPFYPSLISFSSFTFPDAPNRIFLLSLPRLPCHFYLVSIPSTTTYYDSNSLMFFRLSRLSFDDCVLSSSKLVTHWSFIVWNIGFPYAWFIKFEVTDLAHCKHFLLWFEFCCSSFCLFPGFLVIFILLSSQQQQAIMIRILLLFQEQWTCFSTSYWLIFQFPPKHQPWRLMN